MFIYSSQKPDWINPKDKAAACQEWITECWHEIPFTQFNPNGQLKLVLDRSHLPRLGGLYAVSAVLHPHQLDLPVIARGDKLLRISDRLPIWVDAQKRSQRFVHMAYIGASDNISNRWRRHEKMIDLRAFQKQMVEMKFHLYVDPPWLKAKDRYKFDIETKLIDDLAPLLNFH